MFPYDLRHFWIDLSRPDSLCVIMVTIIQKDVSSPLSPPPFLFVWDRALQAVLEVYRWVQVRMTLTFYSSGLSLPSTGIKISTTRPCFMSCWGSNSGPHARQASTLPTALHPRWSKPFIRQVGYKSNHHYLLQRRISLNKAETGICLWA